MQALLYSKISLALCLLWFSLPANLQAASDRGRLPLTSGTRLEVKQKAAGGQSFRKFFSEGSSLKKFLHQLGAKKRPSPTLPPHGHKKMDKLAIAVFVGGLLATLLLFPVKFFLGSVILSVATLVAAIFAFRRLRRNEHLGGRGFIIAGIVLAILPMAFIGLVLRALSQWN